MAAKRWILNRFEVLLLLAAGIFIGAITGCSVSTPTPSTAEVKLPPGSTLLTGAGATFPSVLYTRWFAVYHDVHPNTYIRYAAVGSGEGVRRFVGAGIRDEEKIDFGASDAAMSDAELAQTNNDTLLVPVTAGCVVLAYNLPTLRGELKLFSSSLCRNLPRRNQELERSSDRSVQSRRQAPQYFHRYHRP